MNFFVCRIRWENTGDPFFPYEAKADGKLLKIQLNDFPDEIMYTLVVDGEPRDEFDNWPETWSR